MASNEGHGFARGDAGDYAILVVFFIFVLLTVLVTASTIRGHLDHLLYPDLQITTLRIVAVCPIFSVLLWVSLAAPEARIFIEVLMGIYEGYVLYCFFALMVLVCGGKSAAVSRIMQRGSPFSIRCCLLCDLKTYKNAEDLLLGLERCVQQLSFVKPFVIFVVAVLVETGVPRAQLLRAAAVVPLVFALMGIVQTYFILKPAMANMAMEMKFLTVKGLVALLAVQQLAINVALTFNTIPEEEGYSQEQEAQRIYAMFVICELVLYSVLMKCVFTPEMFEGVEGPMHEAPKSSVISARTAFLISLRFWRVMAPIEEKDQTLAKSAIEELELLTKS